MIEAKISYKLIVSTLFKEARFAYGVDIVDVYGNVVYSPTYPFVLNPEDTVVLQEFLEDYSNAIIDFCNTEERKRKGFSNYLYHSLTEAKYFKDRMYYRGIYVD